MLIKDNIDNERKLELLQKYWGFNSFRPLQNEIIDHVLQKKDILTLLPTGGGKSLCYQLPAILMQGTCLVISPLIALMQEQVEILLKKGINAAYINSSLNYKDIDRILDNVIYGNVKILYLSPERLQTELFQKRFLKMNLSFVAVDEAHCISEWGNDFRPEYKNIAKLKALNPDLSFIALTATATLEVIKDIEEQLLFKKSNILKKSFKRENIKYSILDCVNKEKVLLKTLKKECSIIYTRSRIKTEEISKFLNKNEFKSDFYHAGLEFKERERKQKQWLNNEFDVMIATNAFGMGIDKPDVRTVIHYELPETLESFYQESGRAGRDGDMSYSFILKNNKDIENLNSRININFPNIEAIKVVFQSIVNNLQIAVGYYSDENYEVDIDIISNNINFSRSKTFYCIKYLLNQGYLSQVNDYQYSMVGIKMPIARLNQFVNSYKKFEEIIDVLIRSYSLINEKTVRISENIISKRLNINKTETLDLLNQLDKQNVINYKPKKSTYNISFLIPRPNIKNLKLASDYLNFKENKIKKTNELINYINHKTECRNITILNYFGEENISKCNNCDNCELGLSVKNNPENIIKKAIFFLLHYEDKSPNFIYSQFSEIIEKDRFNSILKKMIEEELILRNSHNLLFINS